MMVIVFSTIRLGLSELNKEFVLKNFGAGKNAIIKTIGSDKRVKTKRNLDRFRL